MKNSVLSSFREVSDLSKEEWKEKLENSEVRCQWDPDRDILWQSNRKKSDTVRYKGRNSEKICK